MVPRHPREAEAVLMSALGQPKKRPMPHDFGDHALMPLHDLQKLYHVGYRTIVRWRREIGVTFPNGRNGWTTGSWEHKRVTEKPRAKGPIRAARHRVDVKSFLPQADSSVSGRAADYLKRYFVPVCKSETVGKTPGSYIVGHMGMLPTDEMIALAKRKGFDPQEWARVA